MEDHKVGSPKDKLQDACDDAAHIYRNSCSHAVWYVIRKYIPEQKWMNANSLVDEISDSDDWEEVKVSELSKLANEGILVVGGLRETGHGHVIVVYPGPEKRDGGYYYTDKVTGKRVLAKDHRNYALAMSTTMGDWPGAKSNGDKTVYDAWGSRKFSNVKFWKYKDSLRFTENGTGTVPIQVSK